MELCFSLHRGPGSFLKAANVLVSCFSYKGAGTDGSVASIAVFILAVTFVENNCMYSVYFRQSKVLNISNNSIKNELEVSDSRFTSIEIVKSTGVLDVSD